MLTLPKYNPDQPVFDFDDGTSDPALTARFRTYHVANPQIYTWFKRFAFQKINAGAKHLGGKAIMERIRWESPVDANGDAFKVNNSYTSFYVRLFRREFPQYSHLFAVRRSVADEKAV